MLSNLGNGLTRFARATMPALEVAAQMSPVPFVGGAAVLLRQIIDTCEQVSVHKSKAKRLAKRCTEILILLEEQRISVSNTEMQTKMDEAMIVYEGILARVRRWSHYSKMMAFVMNDEIDKGIEKCESELEHTMTIFHMNATFILHNTQAEAMEMQRRDTDEMRQLIYSLLTSHQELRSIVEMPEPDQVAEELMNQGQMQLQELNGDSSRSSQFTEDMPFTSEPESGLWGSNLQSSHPARSYVYRPSTPPARSATVTQWASRLPRSRTFTRRATSVPRNNVTPVPGNNFTEQPSREQQRTGIEQGLLELHRLTGIPPTVKVLNGTVAKEGDSAVVGGAFSDIWRGRWLGQDGKKVAIKVLRNVKASDPKAKKRFEDEVKVWARLENDHILPFYGILTDQGQHIQMVSPWQDNGNVLDYVKSRPETNRIHLLSGGAKGLDYIHSKDITHGNVKCANLLVSPDGEARICDFGMSKVIEEVTETSASATLTASGSARWLAPELIEDLVSSPTKEADTYSFGMTILELITQKHPYANRRRDASVIHDIVVLRKIPERPVEPEAMRWLPGTLWDLMRECWKGQASSRPSMAQVSASIQQIEATNSTPA